jgi:hypothetical protein
MSHQYAGNPNVYPTNVNLVDDADLSPATAATLDVGPTNLADRTAYLAARVKPIGALNWRELVQGITPVSGGGGAPVAGQNCVFWDYLNNVWMVPFIMGNYPTNDGAILLSTSGFDDRNADQWFQFGGSGGPTVGLSGGFNGVDFPSGVAIVPGGASYLVSIVSPGANRTKVISSTPSVGWTTTIGLPATTILSLNMVGTFIGTIVFGLGSSDSANTAIWYSTDGVNWNAQAVGNVIGTGAPELLVKTGILGANAGFIVIPVLAPASEPGTAYAYFTSINGTTWTQRSLNGVIANNETPIGLAFGADGGGPCWILASQVGASSTTRYYRSVDGVTWAFIASTSTRVIQDLVCLQDLWVATTFDLNPGANPVWGVAGQSYVVFSTDGCQTWRRSQGVLSKNLTTSGRQQRAKLVSNGYQLCHYNSSQLRFSDASIAQAFT